MNRPIPVTVIAGFLGSGKTTLLTSLIRSRQSRRLAILINEFGEASIDGAIVREAASGSEEIQIHDFPHGLIAYGSDERFIPTMRAIAARRANVDHVLIETSGLALPTAVMATLQASELASDFILDATLAVVDTPLLLLGELKDSLSGAPAAVASPTATLFKQQLESADLVVLNKIDSLHPDALLSAEALVRKLAPNVRFIELAYQARLDIRLALGLRLHQPTFDERSHPHPSRTRTPQPHGGSRPLDGHAHSGLAAHVHGVATHSHFHEQDPGWLSFVLRSDERQDMAKLEAALRSAAQSEPMLRSKGFVRTDGPERMVLVQGVRNRVSIGADGATKHSALSELVFIGYHLSRAKVAARLAEMTGTTWT